MDQTELAGPGDFASNRQENMTEKPRIAICFPVYGDEATVETVARKSLNVSQIADEYKIVIVDDGSPDNSGKIADGLAETIEQVSVCHHETNMGYGAAIKTGLLNCVDYDWICFTDGDDQYDVNELLHMSKLLPHYDLIITFRYSRIYSALRILISVVYNIVLRALFRSPFRDHSSGLKTIRSSVLQDISLTSKSPFIGAEIIIMVRSYRIGEVGIRTYPREFGSSNSTSLANIAKSIKDMLRVRREIFNEYKL